MARQFFNLADVMGQVDNARLRDAQIQNSNMQMQQEQRLMQRQMQQDADLEAQRGIYRGAIDNTSGTPKLNEAKLIEGMLQQNPEMAIKLQEQFQTRDINANKLKRENEKYELSLKSEKAKYWRDALATATPETYTGIIQEAANQGMGFANNAPPQYDPNFIKQNVMTADKFLESQKPKAPTTRTVRIGNEQVSQEFDESTGQFKEIGRGSAFAPKDSVLEGTYSTKPLPTTSLKLQNEALEKLSIASNNNSKLGDVLKQIDDGKLNLGLYSNLEGKVRNYTGLSNESSRNLSSFRSTLEKLRNDSLRLNTGVQTDGDAQRAWNELFENINDEDLVKQRLKEIQEINVRGAELQKLQVESIRSNYNAEPIDFSRYEVPNKPIMPKNEKMPKPKSGTIDGGYVFLGGDPANPKSWKKAK